MQMSAAHAVCCTLLHVDAACDILGCCRWSLQNNDIRHSSATAQTRSAAVADGQLLPKRVHALLHRRHCAMQQASLQAGELGGIMH